MLGSCALAETQTVKSTAHFVIIDESEVVTQPDGTRVEIGGLVHAVSIDDDTGEQSSQRCRGNTVLDDSDAPVVGAGFCTLIADNGDIAWFSFRNKAGQPNTWTAMGGTGQFEGQTGSGTGQIVSQRGDGRGWTTKFEGTLTTP